MKQSIVRDIIEMVALAMIGVGVAFVYWPAALIVVGVILLTVSLLTRPRCKEAHNDRTIA